MSDDKKSIERFTWPGDPDFFQLIHSTESVLQASFVYPLGSIEAERLRDCFERKEFLGVAITGEPAPRPARVQEIHEGDGEARFVIAIYERGMSV